MALLTLARFSGKPDELAARYLESAPTMDEVGRDHGLLLHAAATTADGLLLVNLWPSEAGSPAAARDARRLGVLRDQGVDPGEIRKEHHPVVRYVLFEPVPSGRP